MRAVPRLGRIHRGILLRLALDTGEKASAVVQTVQTHRAEMGGLSRSSRPARYGFAPSGEVVVLAGVVSVVRVPGVRVKWKGC